MSLQGPLIVVADQPAADLLEALRTAGAFPIVETNWTDAPTAFVSVKPAAVVIADPGPPPSEAAARMLCLQIATQQGPLVPTLAAVDVQHDAAIANALPVDAGAPPERLVARLQTAMRVRALHATVLRRLAADAALPPLPIGDALADATVLVAGRGPLYPALSVAIGEQVKMIGALSVESAARHLAAREIDGIVIGDGFSPRMVEAFLTVLAQDQRYRDVPIAAMSDIPATFADSLSNFAGASDDPDRIVARIVPMVRMHAFETRLKRMLTSLDAGGMLDPETGLLTHDAFWRELTKALAEAADRSLALSIARFTFEGLADERARLDAARLVTKLVRAIDFAVQDTDGAILTVFTQTDLRSAHVVARRIAGALKNALNRAPNTITANVTLATLKAGDTLDSLMLRVMGSRMVAAE